MQSQIDRKSIRRRIRYRIRRKIRGTAERPRLAVFRSVKHIYAQIIDDDSGKTLYHASTQEKEVASPGSNGCNVEAAKQVGGAIADRLKSSGISRVVFDRGGLLFHGRVKALADEARARGLKF